MLCVNRPLLSHSRNFLHRMGPDCSLPCRQQGRRLSLSWTRWIQSSPSHTPYLYYSRYAVSVAQSLCCENSFSWPHNFVCPSINASHWLSRFFHRGENGRCIKLTDHHLLSRLRMAELYFSTSLCVCGVDRDSLTLDFITILGFLILEHGTHRFFRNVG